MAYGLRATGRRSLIMVAAVVGALGGAGAPPVRGQARGTGSVLTTPQAPGQVINPQGLAVDGAGNLYVADWGNSRVQERDAQGRWTVITTQGTGPGQVDHLQSLAADGAGNLYVADQANEGRVQVRDAQGRWTVLAPYGRGPGQVYQPSGLAVDGAGNLYVADLGVDGHGRVQERDAQGRWTVLAPIGTAPGQVNNPRSLAVDGAGNLYVAEKGDGFGRVQKYTVTGKDLLPGDLDGDGKVAPIDALLALRAVLGSVPLTPDQAASADVNKNGRVEIDDVALILRVGGGVLSVFP